MNVTEVTAEGEDQRSTATGCSLGGACDVARKTITAVTFARCPASSPSPWRLLAHGTQIIGGMSPLLPFWEVRGTAWWDTCQGITGHFQGHPLPSLLICK